MVNQVARGRTESKHLLRITQILRLVALLIAAIAILWMTWHPYRIAHN